MTKDPTGIIRTDERFTPEFTQLYNRGHVMHAVVPIEDGRTFLHVINFYGQTGARNFKALKAKRHSWIESIFEVTATIGHDAAIILGGDFNDDIFLNPIINNAIESRI